MDFMNEIDKEINSSIKNIETMAKMVAHNESIDIIQERIKAIERDFALGFMSRESYMKCKLELLILINRHYDVIKELKNDCV